MNVQSVSDIYKHVLTEALQVPCEIDDGTIENLHTDLLKTLTDQVHDLIRQGRLNGDALSPQFFFETTELFKQAKEANKKRRYQFRDHYKSNGLYKFGVRYPSKVIKGGDNERVISDIRSWLCNFGPHIEFTQAIWGYQDEVGKLLDGVKSQLSVDNLMRNTHNSLLTRSWFTSSSMREADLKNAQVQPGFNASVSVTVPPIQVKFYMHDPTSVQGNVEIKYKKKTYKLNGREIELTIPCLRIKDDVTVTLLGNIVFEVSKKLTTRLWYKVCTIGLGNVFDRDWSKKFTHDVTIELQCPVRILQQREKLKIEISQQQAKKFMEKMKAYEEGMQAIESRFPGHGRDPTLTYNMLAGKEFPWEAYVEMAREGGVDAAMAMVEKQAPSLANLPARQSVAAGVAFEELQNHLILAKARQLGVPLEFIQGDGHGTFMYNGVQLETPVYTDGVFVNTQTGETFAVQYKCTDTCRLLNLRFTEWYNKWANSGRDMSNLPDALKLDNIQRVGPGDVAKNAAPDIQGEINAGEFKQEAITHEDIKRFFDDNQELFTEIATSKSIDSRNTFISKNKVLETKIERVKSNIQRLQNEPQNDANVKALEGIKKNLNTLEETLTENQKQLQKINDDMKTDIENRLVRNFTGKEAAKEVAKGALAGFVIPGVIAMIISSDQQIRRYRKGEISLGKCVGTVVYDTAKTGAVGALFGGGLSLLNIGAQYTTNAGSLLAKPLTGLSYAAGPVLLVGALAYQSYHIEKLYSDGLISASDLHKSYSRALSTTGISLMGGVAAASLLTGPFAPFVVGAGFAIVVAVGDYYLGDKLWSLVFDETPEQIESMVEKRKDVLTSTVLKAAYDLFELTDKCTDEELKEAYRVAILKYHPDKGGQQQIFVAVKAAYCVIKEHRPYNTHEDYITASA